MTGARAGALTGLRMTSGTTIPGSVSSVTRSTVAPATGRGSVVWALTTAGRAGLMWPSNRPQSSRRDWRRSIGDLPVSHDFRDQWSEVPENDVYDNGFKRQWEEFLAHVVADAPYGHDLYAGARGVQLAELGLQSAREGRKIVVGDL